MERTEFLNVAAIVQGGILVLALVLGWFVGVNPWAGIRWDVRSVVWGIGATVPMFVLFVAVWRLPIPAFERVYGIVLELLGELLSKCRWYDFVLLAIAAGLCEELLFRGVLQVWLTDVTGSLWAALLISNLMFAAAHLITPTYALLAGIIGVYLGWVMHFVEPPNLLVPLLAHTLYDFVGFVFIAVAWKQRQRQRQRELADGEDGEDELVPR